MIRSYKFAVTPHAKLHEFVMNFFKEIEHNVSGFGASLFDSDFWPIVKRHPGILKQPLKVVYQHCCGLTQEERSLFVNRIKESNEIEQICYGLVKPQKLDGDCQGIDKTIRELFLKLYTQVLDGKAFRDNLDVTLRQHFDEFSRLNDDITLCPICGIGELKKAQDKSRDQYDHFLPKSLYPFSSVNFCNLVLCCRECNSFDAKGDKDIVALSQGKLFYPYDQTHKGISLVVKIRNDSEQIGEIDWVFNFDNPEEKNEEIESWKTIYNIEDRYNGHVKARVKKWYDHYFAFIKSSQSKQDTYDTQKKCYMRFLEGDESEGLNFIRKPVLEGLLSDSLIAQAEIEAMEYALND